jgi:hypothetical protein
MSTPPRVIHEFEAGRGTIRTTLTTLGGREYVDLRLWVEPRDQPGAALIPTKRGISLPLEFLDEAREALQAVAEAIAQERGELAGRRRSSRRSSSRGSSV